MTAIEVLQYDSNHPAACKSILMTASIGRTTARGNHILAAYEGVPRTTARLGTRKLHHNTKILDCAAVLPLLY